MDFIPAALTANELQKQIDRRVHKEVPQEHMFSAVYGLVTEVRADLKVIAEYISDTSLPPIDEAIQLQVSPWTWTLRRKGRRYGVIFSPNGTAQLTITVPQMGTLSAYTPPLGPSTFDYPEGTQISLASGGPTTFLYRCTNIPLGS